MPKYVSLINWTDEGVKNYKDAVDRFEAAQKAASAAGARFIDAYWTLGSNYDLVVIVEAPDDETAAALGLMTAAAGNTRGTTLRAFDADEMRAIIAKTG
jgi:uncharacterized protein with GYD domain